MTLFLSNGNLSLHIDYNIVSFVRQFPIHSKFQKLLSIFMKKGNDPVFDTIVILDKNVNIFSDSHGFFRRV